MQILGNYNKIIQQKDERHKRVNKQLLIEQQNLIQQLKNDYEIIF